MVEIKEVLEIKERETGTIVASFKTEEKTTLEVSVLDLRENLNIYKDDLNSVYDDISSIDDEIANLQNKKNLLIEKRNALNKSISVVEDFLKDYPEEDEEVTEDGVEEESEYPPREQPQY